MNNLKIYYHPKVKEHLAIKLCKQRALVKRMQRETQDAVESRLLKKLQYLIENQFAR
jgi:hypothetical protein